MMLFKFEYVGVDSNPNAVALVVADNMQKAVKAFHDKVQLGLLKKVTLEDDDIEHVFVTRHGKIPVDILNNSVGSVEDNPFDDRGAVLK